MATPNYTALIAKVRDWSNKPSVNTIPDSVIGDCLSYAADECYRQLRIPPLEYTTTYKITSLDNSGEASLGMPYGNAYTSFTIPEDLVQFCYVRTLAQNDLQEPYSTFPSNVSKVFNEITDKRTFFDAYSEKYSLYNFMWMDNRIFIHPQLPVGTIVEINYYRRLCSLDAVYSVLAINYIKGLDDSIQPYLALSDVSNGSPLYFSSLGNAFDTSALAATDVGSSGAVTTKYYVGKEAPNWLKDQNERLLLWGALQNLAGYLFDDKMEQRYAMKFQENIASLNKEEKWRRSLGGNVQINFNTGGLL